MKRIPLVGKYPKGKASSCEFEDIPHFVRMADFQENNHLLSEVVVIGVERGMLILSKSKITRWRIVFDQQFRMILAFRTRYEKDCLPFIYEVREKDFNGEVSLFNITDFLTREQREDFLEEF